MHRIRAITLDLDDTLWEIGPVIRRAEEELWLWLGARYPRITERYTRELALELRQSLARRYPHKAHDFRFLRKSTLAEMAVASGYAEGVAQDAFDVFDRWRNTVDLFPDVEPALEQLGDRYRLFALTNGNACLRRTGVHRYFSGIISAAETGVAKPEPAIFAAAIDRAGVAPDEVLHVGDHPELDVIGAAGAGMRTAWINRARGEWPAHLRRPDAEVASMTELTVLLGKAVRRE